MMPVKEFLFFCGSYVLLLFEKSFVVVLRVHCGIYKSSYNVLNISYLDSPPPLFSFSPLSPFLK
jgi:hypothetical protein